ncbi:hypothetical protein [Streptomyces meridianus]|uniref:Secreted protein n=1 Tax=Streptomyces meridianus TaxID=2938945 RepID=A0ABT0X2G6_9ACTN|nr:hypothetical protein [Streptomyces meridianus]MCM2576123.1 hypothetical protein [Streptomyces meridianus]
MRKLRKAAVVAVMVGSMGMFGAGVAAAGGHGDGGTGLGDFIVNNPQFMNCEYSGNTATGLTQVTGAAVDGDTTQTMNLGNVCAQTGPVFEG